MLKQLKVKSRHYTVSEKLSTGKLHLAPNDFCKIPFTTHTVAKTTVAELATMNFFDTVQNLVCSVREILANPVLENLANVAVQPDDRVAEA